MDKNEALQIHVVTAVRNEQEFLPGLIESMLNQIKRPDRWYIVDDGSSDSTGSIIRQVQSKYDWIVVIKINDRGFDSRGLGNIQALQKGFVASTRDISPELIGILDADIVFEKNTFQKVENAFRSDEKLGVYGGEIIELKRGKWLSPVTLPEDFVRGAFKIYRLSCFKEIKGLRAVKGWNVIDNMYALMRGWKVKRDASILIKHVRPKGQRDGIKDNQKAANNAYYLNSDSLLVLVRGLRRMVKERPFILSGLIFLSTYFIDKLLRKKQFPDAKLLNFIHKRHRAILLQGYYDW